MIKNNVRVNDKIRMSPIIVIDSEGTNLGSMAIHAAIKMAKESGLDLVEVAPQNRPPICRMMDYGKFKYEQNLKDRKNKKTSKSEVVKEVRLRPVTGENDAKRKANDVSKFLQQGHRVIIKVRYERRELIHKDKGFDIINSLLAMVSEHGKAANKPLMNGNQLTCMVEPLKSE